MATVVQPLPAQQPIPRGSTAGAAGSAEQRFVLDAVDWPSYVKIADGIGERHVRVTYDQGSIELMTTSYLHEWWSERLHTVIMTLALELNVELQSGGSTTICREFLARGVEPDQCYFIASARRVAGPRDFAPEDVPAPDLAVEFDISRSSLDRMGIYAAIGVPEVWRFDGSVLRVQRLNAQRDYDERKDSASFPTLPLERLSQFLSSTRDLTDTALIRAIRGWVAAGFNVPPGP
jgi:Uma2 family endonuclease